MIWATGSNGLTLLRVVRHLSITPVQNCECPGRNNAADHRAFTSVFRNDSSYLFVFGVDLISNGFEFDLRDRKLTGRHVLAGCALERSICCQRNIGVRHRRRTNSSRSRNGPTKPKSLKPDQQSRRRHALETVMLVVEVIIGGADWILSGRDACRRSLF